MVWVKNKETAFKNIYKNLKPGGSFGMQVGIQMAKLFDQITELMGAETVQLINDKLVVKFMKKFVIPVGFHYS